MLQRLGCTLLAAATLSGCATYMSWRKREGLDYFVGRPEPALVAALGKPSRQWQGPQGRFLAYESSQDRWVSGEPGVRTPDTEIPYGPWVNAVNCTTTFKVVAGQVAAWSVDGDGCRGDPFPPVRDFAESRMQQSPDQDVSAVTQFSGDAYTGRSNVEYGKFYTR